MWDVDGSLDVHYDVAVLLPGRGGVGDFLYEQGSTVSVACKWQMGHL
jgi:hypothetical protein